MTYATIHCETPDTDPYWVCPYCGHRQDPDFVPVERRKYESTGRIVTIYGATCDRCDENFTVDEDSLKNDLNYRPSDYRIRVIG